MRYFFEISYNGTAYNGWQRQPNALGVQQVVEEAMSTYFRNNIEIIGSGRTDTGVHCKQQFFHTDLQVSGVGEQDLFRLNCILPADISLIGAYPVAKDAHARFDALDRYYEYKITTIKDPFLSGLAATFYRELDVETMDRLSSLLIGTHDFTSFSRVKTEVNTFICTIFEAFWRTDGHVLTFCIRGNRFLRGMVRALVGTLLLAGQGRLDEEGFRKIIEAKDRKKAGMAAPPEGLYLTEVRYAEGTFKK